MTTESTEQENTAGAAADEEAKHGQPQADALDASLKTYLANILKDVAKVSDIENFNNKLAHIKDELSKEIQNSNTELKAMIHSTDGRVTHLEKLIRSTDDKMTRFENSIASINSRLNHFEDGLSFRGRSRGMAASSFFADQSLSLNSVSHPKMIPKSLRSRFKDDD